MKVSWKLMIILERSVSQITHRQHAEYSHSTAELNNKYKYITILCRECLQPLLY